MTQDDNMSILVREMNECDIEFIADIEKRTFPCPWSMESFREELNLHERAMYLVAEVNGKKQPKAYAGMWIVLDEAHITNIAVEPELRGKGIGTILLNALFDCARTRDIKSMTLEVRESNIPAQKLYQRLGFFVAGKRNRYYSDNQENALIMWKNL